MYVLHMFYGPVGLGLPGRLRAILKVLTLLYLMQVIRLDFNNFTRNTYFSKPFAKPRTATDMNGTSFEHLQKLY